MRDVATVPTWADAACIGHADLFFGPDNETRDEQQQREARAKAICDTCPLAAACATGAYFRHERYGVWGSSTESDRRNQRRRQRRARQAA